MDTEPFHSLLFAGLNIKIYPVSLITIIWIIILIILLLGSALISASEVAFFSLSPNEKEHLKHSRHKHAHGVLKLLDSPNRLLATILIGNNFINVAIVILSTYITSHLFDFSASPRLGFFFQVVIITFLLILFGEIIPKIYATGNAVRVARFIAPLMIFIIYLFRPLSSLLILLNSWVKKRVNKSKQAISINDLTHVLELASGAIDEDKEILEGIVKFGRTYVKEIMRSRVDVIAVDINDRFNELLSTITKSGFSRIPVYSKTLDSVKGILYVKDLLPHLNQPGTFRWQALIRPAYFVPETKRISELLKEFQSNKIHMSLVIDEYGGVQGLITLEDILEEIVGEIVDETDEEKPLFSKLGPDTFVFEAKISLNDFFKITDLPDDIFDKVKGEAETLAGLILELTGEIPEKNAVVKQDNFTFEVVEVDKKRIKKIRVRINRKTDKQEVK